MSWTSGFKKIWSWAGRLPALLICGGRSAEIPDQSLPLCRIEMGLGRRAGPPAFMCAFCTATAAFGAGNIMPSNTVARSLVDALGLLSARDR